MGRSGSLGQVRFEKLKQGRHRFDGGFGDGGPFGFRRVVAAGDLGGDTDLPCDALHRAVAGDALAEIVATAIIRGMKFFNEVIVEGNPVFPEEDLSADFVAVEDELKQEALT